MEGAFSQADHFAKPSPLYGQLAVEISSNWGKILRESAKSVRMNRENRPEEDFFPSEGYPDTSGKREQE
jgi:hypothetical protein